MKASFQDGKLQQDVLHELEWDSRVDCTQIGVTVQGAVVTLHGTVDSWAAKLAAQDAAHRVDGVLDVANELVVAPKSNHLRSDAEIAAAARHALTWDVFVPDDKIQTTVTHGIVLLEGEVDTRRSATRPPARWVTSPASAASTTSSWSPGSRSTRRRCAPRSGRPSHVMRHEKPTSSRSRSIAAA
ncbi:MAG: BON domain-containing protein [Myxococcales bacterium]|nr:BON domain-containing protein [Myxococcales bacterium]